MKVCIIQPRTSALSETFLVAQATGIGAQVKLVYRDDVGRIACDGRPVLSAGLAAKVQRRVSRAILHRKGISERTLAYTKAVSGCDVVLAQYGMTGVHVVEACRLASKPLVVHFHGFDASQHDVIEKHRLTYPQMFQRADAIIAVSRAMRDRLLEIGCPQNKILINVYGAALQKGDPVDPGQNAPVLLSVGRFVEKKAPHLTVAAFAQTLARFSGARLRMIGDGPLLNACKDLAEGLGLAESIHFMGAQPHHVVLQEMRSVRAFVQHSIVSRNGDSEGTPVAILEAGACGLPVVATRHAGIPDVTVHGHTGCLVNEKDVGGMADAMLSLIQDPSLATRLGANAASHIRSRFTVEQSCHRLTRILSAVSRQDDLEQIRRELDSLLAPVAKTETAGIAV